MDHATGVRLPSGRQIAVTWKVGTTYGGMTAALLRRMEMFRQSGARDLVIATYDSVQDVPGTESALQARGVLARTTSLRNIWFEVMHSERLSFLSNGKLQRLGLETAQTVLMQPGDEFERTTHAFETGAEVVTLSRKDAKDRLIAFKRPGGTLAALDWCWTESGTDKRVVAAFAPDGSLTGTWDGVWEIYRAWTDMVIGNKRSFLVVDSKALVPFFTTYSHPNAYIMHVVHGAHLALAAADASGPLSPQRAAMVKRGHRLDAVVLLTEQQREDVAARASTKARLVAIPNSTSLPENVRNTSEPGSGALVAQFSARKRVDHAISAIAQANKMGIGEVTLDIYGGGALRSRLEKKAGSQCPGKVRFRGFVQNAADELTSHSFLLLTSNAEGLPLVLAEAMARGCLPIAYDIRYGPRNIIDDGVDGFLIPAGDTAAVAEAIKKLVTMPALQRDQMRKAAIRKASQYSDATVAERWAELERTLVATRPRGNLIRTAIYGILWRFRRYSRLAADRR